MKVLSLFHESAGVRHLVKTQFLCVILFSIIYPNIIFGQDNYVFGPSIIVNDDTPGTCDRACSQRSIACRGDTVFLTWSDVRFGYALVFFSKSTDGGNTWSPNLVVSQNIAGNNCGGSHLCLDVYGNIYISYRYSDTNSNADIYFVKSTNGGSTFSVPVLVNDSSAVPQQIYPSCAVDSSGQYVYIAYQDGRNPQFDSDVYFARSTDGGASFLPAVRVNDDSVLANQWYPVVACDNSGQNIYVAWADPRDSLHGFDVYFSRSTDYGQTFEPNYPINDTATTDTTPQDYPSIYYKNGIVYAAWHDGRDGYAVYFARSIDEGFSFGPNVRVSDNPNSRGYDVSITVDDSAKIYAVWHDFRNFNPYGWEIYFSFSPDSGQTFKPNVRVNDHLGNLDAIDDNPSICINESARVLVAWDSDRNDHQWGYEDIYCATGTYVGIQEYYADRPSMLSLECYPNPFTNTLNIRCELPKNASSRQKSVFSVKIFDAAGRLVKEFSKQISTLWNQSLIFTWYGDNQEGYRVPIGVYFVENISNGNKCTIKVVKTK